LNSLAERSTKQLALDACLAAILLAAILLVVINHVQEPVDRAFATPPYTRVGN
jgi:hypothetical protein